MKKQIGMMKKNRMKKQNDGEALSPISWFLYVFCFPHSFSTGQRGFQLFQFWYAGWEISWQISALPDLKSYVFEFLSLAWKVLQSK
jgi:hypothetical protein